MYEAFYGFKEKPFSMLPDPSFLFLSKKHRAALTLLEYGLMNQVGFCILSGEPGTGKTTILRSLLNRVDDNVKVGLISNTHQSFGGLLDWILSAFDLHKANLTQVEMHQLFVDFLIDEYANNRRVLLIIDEAQNMDPDSLEELRMLSNVNTEKDQLLQVVLAGQPQLKANLRKPELSQFAQRIAVDYHLHSLNLNETCGYIQHRLVVAGAERDVFTPEACERIHCYSGGSPRLINLLCETALVYGFADEKELIDADLVEEMVQERMEDSVVPLVNLNGDNEASSKNNEKLIKDFPWIRPEGGTKGLKPKIKAELESVQKEEKASEPEISKSEASELSASIKPLSTQQAAELELPLPDDLISQANVLGAEAIDDVAVKPASEVVPDIDLAQADTTSIDMKKETTYVEEKIDGNKEENKPELVSPDSTQANDALAKEMFAKKQIDEATPKKNNILKYGIYAGVIAAGLAIVALFFSDYSRNNRLFEGINEQVAPVLDKKNSDESRLGNKGSLSADTNSVDMAKQEAEKKTNEAEREKLEQKKLKKEQLEKENQEKKSREKETQAKLTKEKEAKAELDRLKQEKLTQEQEAKELAARENERREGKKREAREREANENRRIEQKIKQREAELEAKAETRRLQFEAESREEMRREREQSEKKIQQEQEAIQLEKEWLEKQRKQLREAKANTNTKTKESVPDEGFVSESKKKLSLNCEGPAARFKAACR